ncbi:MoaD/ThiS family protein [Idiomarina seosinensis]|uniref:Molybdopterin synthase sulfur carrier subunit n=1 Tax=Idiomarina seosinensis TaxID=281739 RepID=A0A432ZDW6_9GAMM|nr:MoaD/ThiS family protein [Idiomarina seosinensis]RUO76111.1 molybdopterin synthase sulfur carrier subunit [Idiomarina seosinensis]
MLTIKFFAVLRERLSSDRMQLPLEQPKSVSEVVEQLKQQSQLWHKELSRYDLLCAVNQEFADHSTVVKEGDELALFPPVTGG